MLVLDFVDNARGKKPTNPAFGYTLPPALTPAATKKLVERRNDRFVEAVNEWELHLSVPLLLLIIGSVDF